MVPVKIILRKTYMASGHERQTRASCRLDCRWFRIWEVFEFGERKEDDKMVLFYHLHRWCIVAARIGAARSGGGRCPRQTGQWRWQRPEKLNLNPNVGKNQKNGLDPWRKGEWRREEDDATKKKSRGRGDRERRRRAYFYAQGNPICQLIGDGELGWGTIGECFFYFFLKNKDGEEK